MAKINFNDKTYLDQNPSIADENKVNDTDLNELKYGTNDILDLLGLSTNTYNSSTNYAIGNRVIYNNQIYECTAATTGSWDSTKWQLIPLFDNLNINFELIPDIYSTTETLTNKIWNGKPVYRKIYIGNSISSNINLNISDYEDIVTLEVKVRQNGVSSWRPLPWLFVQNNTMGTPWWAGGFYFSNGELSFQTGDTLKNIDRVNAIIEYTKTTD
jgi:hypothetical protein